MLTHLWTEKVIRRSCLCVCASELAAVFSCVDPALTHTCSVTAPQRTDGGNSSDVDKWARSGMDSPAGNTAMQPAAATHEQNGNSDRPES